MSGPTGGSRLGQVLSRVRRLIGRYVVLPGQHAEVAVSLWVAYTWVFDTFDRAPYLVIKSPTKRCGKTRVLEILELVVRQPWRVVQPSEAVLFRRIHSDRPTLLLDEADATFAGARERAEPLRALLNAGNARGARVARCVPPGWELQDFAVYCPKAIAAIGDLPDTLEDRSVVIRMNRATPQEEARVRRARLQHLQREASALSSFLRAWSEDGLVRQRLRRPVRVPAALDGRAADAWEPLLAVAREAGAGWYRRAREAAVALSAGRDRFDADPGVQLLRDLRQAFRHTRATRLATEDILRYLTSNPHRPWADWAGRGPLTPRALASLLERFAVRPRKWWDGRTVRGYAAKDLKAAWERYTPSLRTPEPPERQKSVATRVRGSSKRQALADPRLSSGGCETAGSRTGSESWRSGGSQQGVGVGADRAAVLRRKL